MARNGSGTFNLNATYNPVVTNTTITSLWANTTLSDIGNEITNSLPRDGQAGMNAALKHVDGTVSVPGLTFNSESSTGIYRVGTGVLGITVSGNQALTATTSGIQVPGLLTTVGNHVIGNSTNNVTNIQFLGALETVNVGTTANGFEFNTANNQPFIWTNNAISRLTLDAAGQLALQSASIGGNRQLTVSNPDNTNAASNARIVVSTGGASSGDPYIIFDQTGVFDWSIGSDTSDSHKFKISAYPTLGTNDAVIIDTSGNVGVGMSPTYKLNVAGDIFISPTPSTNAGLLRITNGGGNAYLGLDNSSGGLGGAYSLNMWHGGAYPLVFATSNVERARIDSSGNLLVGTTAAAWGTAARGVIEVNGSGTALIGLKVGNVTGSYLYNDGTNSNLMHTPATGSLVFGTAGVTRANLDAVGNFGIGVAPTSRLDVNGDITLRGNIIGPSTSAAYTIAANPSASITSGGWMAVWGSTSGNPGVINWGNAGVERMRLDANGALGVGVAPSYKIHASASGSNAVIAATSSDASGGTTYMQANSSSDARIGCITNIPFLIIQNSVQRASFTTAGAFDITGGSGKLTMNGGITRFESATQTVSAAMVLSVAHGGPRKPDIVRGVLRCNTANLGYSIGDEVDILNYIPSGSAGGAVWANATNVGYTSNGSTGYIVQKSTNAYALITNASWNAVLYCIWL